MKTATKLLTLVLVSLFYSYTAAAQAPAYTLDESSTMVVTGTSTLHDWEADVNEMDLMLNMDPALMNAETPQSPVESLTFKAGVKSIDSGKGGMDKRIDGALDAKKHPYIIFELISAELDSAAMQDSSFTLNVTGTLNIAGKTKEVSFPVTGMMESESAYRFEGSYGLNMKDYDVDPPSAMFGAIKCGEEVEIKFNLLVNADLAN